ncbi:MAG: hypothetical protein ACR2JR_07840 [Rubrobacteraceae bacterium]
MPRRTPGQTASPSSRWRVSETSLAVRVCLLISTHALPPFSYRVPEHLAEDVHPGSAVVAPLSGYPRLGIVIGPDESEAGEYELEDVAEVVGDLSISGDVVEVCRWASEAAAVPLAAVLRAALPPGVNTTRYRVVSPSPGWPWERGVFVGRAALRKALGAASLKEAERMGRVMLSPALPQRRKVEWAVLEDGPDPDLSRAPRQRAVMEMLKRHGNAYPVSNLLSEAGARRDALRQLVRRGTVRLEGRPQTAPLFGTHGEEAASRLAPFSRSAGRIVDLGGAWVWRTLAAEWPEAVAAVVLAASEGGEQTLVLVPEREIVEGLVRDLRRLLPPGLSIAPYHGGLGRDRAAVFEAAREGSVDVVVGTRSAALLPMARPGAVCVVDEPNGAHRAEPGFEGVPIHARDLALRRGEIEGSGVLCLSPVPSLRLYAPENRIRELPARAPGRWPSVRVVDMRGTGATFSSALLDECRRRASTGGRVGVVANWVGYAATVYCDGCGVVRTCPECGLPLEVHGEARSCGRCGYREGASGECQECGSERKSSTVLTAERMRAELSRALGEPVGFLTASVREQGDARVVVGTARRILDGEWDAVIMPDVDFLLLGSGMDAGERAFRLIHGSAQAARERLLVQTRVPDNLSLQSALRDDYPAFAAAELPRLRSAGYPPYAHLAAVTFEGPEESVRRAVESGLLPALESGVEASGLTPFASPGAGPAWRLLLRSRDRSAVARAATLAARLAAKSGKAGPRVRVDVEPEEV